MLIKKAIMYLIVLQKYGNKMTSLNRFNQPVGYELKNWTGKDAPTHRALQGAYCILEPLTIDDEVKTLYHALGLDNDGSSWTYLPYGPFNNFYDFDSWLRKTLAEEQKTLLYTIRKVDQPEPLGVIGYLNVNPSHGVLEIGHVHFSKPLQKTPAATEAIYLMINHALEDLNYRRCEWKCNSLNQPSIKAALRIGFTFEGTFRQSNVFKNKNRDTSWFSILDHEWPKLAKCIQTWLHHDNFDQSGIQKTALNTK
jgi:RimJ/RimL family protein N-acetyltransferase